MDRSTTEQNPGPKKRFGVFEYDPQARELTKHGVRLKLQEQPVQILAALLEQAGQIVPREELQRRLWPDGTFVDYEQSLNKAVNKLREALGDSTSSPIYIETLARRGYRFIAPVEVDSPKEAPAQERKPARSHAGLWWTTGALGLVTAAILVTGLWPVPAARARVTQLTHGGRLSSAYLALQGGRILYGSSDERLVGQFWSISTEGGEPRRERMPFLDPEHMAWLADCRSSALLIVARGVAQMATIPGELWLAGFDGSKPRRIGGAAGDSGYSVSPDLKTLLRSSKEGLFVRPVDGGPERRVARVDWNTPSYTFWHPSGERIGFLVLKDRRPNKVWEVKTDGTGMRPLLPQFQAEQRAANWSPDGKRLYFKSQGELYVLGSRRWLGWMRRPQPQRLTAGSVSYWLPYEDPTDPRVIYAGGELAGGEAMKLNKQTGIFEPYLGGLSGDCLDYSPDGQWIAYVSFPGRELWKCRRDGSDKVLLEDGMLTYMPRWSPDGKRLAFAATRKGVWADPHRIFTIPTGGGKAEPVKGASGPGFDPNWSPDGKKLVFAPLRDDVVPKQDRHVSIVDPETGQVQMVPGSENMFSARWSPDGKHLVALRDDLVHSAIYDFETQHWADLDADVFGFFGFPTWSKDSKYVYLMAYAPVRLARIEVATRKLEEIRSIKEFCLAGTMAAGVSWTPDGEPVVLADRSTQEIYRLDVEW
jgi:DNA-binding winged helix-turn-helix (wHTH) protein/WD40 repeat protein